MGRFLWLIALLTILTGTLRTARAEDAVARLQRELDAGKATLPFTAAHGYLPSVLAALHVPADSQGLVFSRTSFQAARISPADPRAIYFSDDVYVGWVPNGTDIEVAAVDPKEGPVFYMLPQNRVDRPRFLKQSSACFQCHQSEVTGDMPGLLMRSVYPDPQGLPVFSAGTFQTTDESPIAERWGGWYVDGTAAVPGMGNAVLDDPDRPQAMRRIPFDRNHLDLARYVGAHSDVIALMVLTHQTHLHNLLTLAAHETELALAEEKAVRDTIGSPAGTDHSPETQSRIAAACDPVLRAMLFCDAAPPPPTTTGSTDFAARFERLGPFDAQGRSLRQFDLHRRLFKYPCSYLIYSDQFDALPEAAKEYLYRQLWKVLTGRDDSPDFNSLNDADRAAIYRILLATKPSLPDYWRKHPPDGSGD